MLVPCESAMSVICKVKIPPQMLPYFTEHRGPVIILVSCELASLWFGQDLAGSFFQGFCFLSLFILLSQRMEAVLECFGSILGAGSYSYTQYNYTNCRKKKLENIRRAKKIIRWRWMTCIAACGGYILLFMIYSIMLRKVSIFIYIYIFK